MTLGGVIIIVIRVCIFRTTRLIYLDGVKNRNKVTF